MTRVSKRNFGESLSHAIEASDSKENNLKTIFGIINDVKTDIEEFTDGKVSINFRDSQKHMMYKAAAYYSTFDKTNPILNKPTNQVLFLVSTIDDSQKQDLTVLELGSEGFPCTIYVEGNRMTAADAESFEENLNDLLSSPSTGEKLKSLITIEVKDTVEVEPDLPLIEEHSTITPSNLKSG
ncbi:hypothetical protein A0159_RS08845 [Acinetobacter baumannii]|nr:hypothetical protein [Acinetobacter baumannii]EHU2751596.1 hypothetical protein [Acinetobacter baumannii]